jgi:hypothetical protein
VHQRRTGRRGPRSRIAGVILMLTALVLARASRASSSVSSLVASQPRTPRPARVLRCRTGRALVRDLHSGDADHPPEHVHPEPVRTHVRVPLDHRARDPQPHRGPLSAGRPMEAASLRGRRSGSPPIAFSRTDATVTFEADTGDVMLRARVADALMTGVRARRVDASVLAARLTVCADDAHSAHERGSPRHAGIRCGVVPPV